MKAIKAISKALLIIFILILLFLAGLFVFHRICIEKEKSLVSQPLGDMIDVNGGKMCVYSCGSGERTLVFMSGFGTPSPILDFRSLYNLLSDDYRIAVVEKFGYGFSDDTDADRNINAMLSDTRSALAGAGIEGPFVLCPHSFSGAEAIYWAQTYPDEVEAIISLDAIVPGYHDIIPVDNTLEAVTKLAADCGLVRLIPDSEISPAVGYGTLTDEEKKICMALTHGRFRTKAMLNEARIAEENMQIISQGNVPEIPILYFISDMGLEDEESIARMRSLPRKYTDGKAEYIDLDCGHCVQNYEYELIAAKIKEFLKK